MLHSLFSLHMNNMPMFSPNLIKPPSLLSAFNTSTSRFMTFWRNLVPNENNNMINIGCPVSFRWEIAFGYICRKSTSLDLIIRFNHSNTGLTPSPRVWETMLSSSVPHYSLTCTLYSIWPTFDHNFYQCWTHKTLSMSGHQQNST